MVLAALSLSKTLPSNRKLRRGLLRTFSSGSQEQISPPRVSGHYGYIDDEDHIPDVEPDDPDLGLLNNSVAALADVFPDVQVEVFREMLSTFGEESRLYVVTETLLKHKEGYVKGRWRVPSREGLKEAAQKAGKQVTVADEERFRSEGYKRAVKETLSQEFRGLPRSSINAVLAEHNYSYTLARPTLLTLSSKSWRFSVSAFFTRRKDPSLSTAKNHPLVMWQPSSPDADAISRRPMLKPTSSPELDRELFTTLILPLQRKLRQSQTASDHALATQINEEEAEESSAQYDCQCCFTSTTFEFLAVCDHSGHYLCFRCIQHAIREALFGQGWTSNIDHAKQTLRCIAPTSHADPCPGSIPQALVRRALLEDDENNKPGDTNTFRVLEDRLAASALLASSLPLIRCPFCPYAEVDDLYLPSDTLRTWRFKPLTPSSLLLIPLLVLLLPLLIPLTLLLFPSSLTRLHHRNSSPQIFSCRSPSCALRSCRHCSALIPHPPTTTDRHICHERTLTSLRTTLENAMSAAVKRTCPICHTSFVKSAGCNKLVCPCGYIMCYVCREGIGGSGAARPARLARRAPVAAGGPERAGQPPVPAAAADGYRHFCEHFRPAGRGPCTQCGKCDLYRVEAEEDQLTRARQAAERAWLEESEEEGGRREDGAVIEKLANELGLRDLDFRDAGWREKRVGLVMPKGKGLWDWSWEEGVDWLVESVVTVGDAM
ncbi:MAG: hypothetical protein M1833_004031 [Piccolia ochrophora]|nr:MAG: hypothetical protein M1833_004031 [Piccolia ochrophora]